MANDLAPIDELRLLALRGAIEEMAVGRFSHVHIDPRFEIALEFRAIGDLYDAETAAIDIAKQLRKDFPEFEFDWLVLPEERHDP